MCKVAKCPLSALLLTSLPSLLSNHSISLTLQSSCGLHIVREAAGTAHQVVPCCALLLLPARHVPLPFDPVLMLPPLLIGHLVTRSVEQ